MNLREILEKLEVYTNIPKLKFEFEADEYVYMANIMIQVNSIIQSLNIIEMRKRKFEII